MLANCLHDLQHHADKHDEIRAVPVFEGQKLVVVGGNRGIGRVTAADAYRREIPCQCERS
jgi:hypothetical protein